MTQTTDPRWPDARDDLARVVATTTPSQRLEWLEDILDIAHRAGALDKARRLEQDEATGRLEAGGPAGWKPALP